MAKKQERDLAQIMERLEALFEREGERLVKDVLWEHYLESVEQKKLDLETGRRGFGLRRRSAQDIQDQIDAEAQDESIKAIRLIRRRLESGAETAFHRVLSGIFKDPVLRKLAIETSARIVGRGGGRPSREAPHIQWLRGRLVINDKADPRPTAKEHLRMLGGHPDVDEVDINGIRLRVATLEQYGYVWQEGKEEPVISLSTVTSLLTKIRKGK